MHSELTAYITLACTSGVLNLYLCLYVLIKRHRYTNIAKLFIVYTICIAIYCFSSALGLLSTTLQELKLWTTVQYIGMPFSPPLGLLFVMHYLGFPVTRRRVILLLAIPVISLCMVATNDWHHLHYRVFEIDPILGAPYVHQEIGVWYMIHGVFTFGSMFVAFWLVIFQWRETAKTYRPQLIALMFGQLVPIVTAFVYLVGLTPPGVDPVPMVLWISSLLYVWSINSSRLFTLMPVAKDAIFQSINDGVLVLDEFNRIIEFNRACQRMLPRLHKRQLGQQFAETWPKLAGSPFPFPLKVEAQSLDLQLAAEGRPDATYQVRITPLEHANQGKGLLLIFTDITELKRLQRQLEHHAYYDELTGAPNRRAFFQQGTLTLEESRQAGEPFTVVLMDVDYFKKVNDTFGHHVGDQVLMHVAHLCQQELQAGELFARYGGEEFVLALKGRTLQEGEAVANRLRTRIASKPLTTTEDKISVTLSLGVAEAADGPEETLSQLLNKADQALYAAKQAGRNRVCVYAGTEQPEK
ncbi:histidine kinase N-terminal 7TM domain-containing protein [Paenibacillus ferrarius]|uniref:histidine kinase N-terminal 7TM domain-containing diguanylate cyclase n=1 Tax=Paenibacillus ferrarius TaxID=1469647 RepID=UPI003D28BA92